MATEQTNPAEIGGETNQTDPTLVTPSGFRIEGITTNDLIKVLKNLK